MPYRMGKRVVRVRMKISFRIFWLFILLGVLFLLTDIVLDHFLLQNLTVSLPYVGEVSASEILMRVFLLLTFWILGAFVARLFYQAEWGKKKREEENFFLQQLLNAIPAPLFYKDRDLKYTGCNTCFETFLSKRKEDLVGKTVFEIAPKHLAEEYHAKDLELLNNPGTQVYEFKVSKPDSEEKNVIFHKATYDDLHGELNGMIGVILDITELRKAELEKEATIAELQKALIEVKTLSGLIPICASCKKIRDDSGYWQKLEQYFRDHASAEFSHSICPDCSDQLFSEYDKDTQAQK